MVKLLNRHSDSRLLLLFQRLMLTTCVVLFLAACTEGYPTEDELIISPHALTQSERLEAMNQLGQEAHPGITWIYRTQPSCILQISVEGGESGRQTFSLQMKDAAVNVSSNKTDKVYGIQVQPKGSDSQEKQPILLSRTWVDAVEMHIGKYHPKHNQPAIKQACRCPSAHRRCQSGSSSRDTKGWRCSCHAHDDGLSNS